MTVVFDTETIRLITFFENLTGSEIRDCLVDDSKNMVYFVIEEGKVGMAIGKNGDSIRNVENLIKKDIRVFEFSEELNTFVRNLIPQATEVRVINENDRTAVEVRVDRKDKPMVIGRDGRNQKLYKELLQRNHSINELIIR